jgi:predicted protein tyrosine phosphatase
VRDSQFFLDFFLSQQCGTIITTTRHKGGDYMTQLATASNGVTVAPTVRSIEEARALAPHFPAVLTVGPSFTEADFGHANHLVLPFADTIDPRHPRRPQRQDVERIIEFGRANGEDMLIHCHMGISRSTAAAVTVLVARGVDPAEAARTLADIHPATRPFAPNDLIIELAADLLDEPHLPYIVREHERYFAKWHFGKYAPSPGMRLGR